MFSRKDSLPSPSLEDSFFPLSSTSSHSLSLAYPSSSSSSCCQGGSGSMGKAGLKAELEAGLETDLILAAELGQALLERNEELAEALTQRDRHVEVLQQEKHVLRRRLEVCELSSQQREAELTSELSSLLAELDRHHSRGQGQKREENTQLTELANHNHRLVEELAEAVSVEHSLRVELRSLREEMEDSSLSKTISSTQLDNTQAENRVLKERLGNMEEQLRLWQEDCDRLRGERERQRDTLTDLQTNLREREDQATETLLAHSTILQDKDQEINTLREKLCSREAELDSLREELQPFRSCQGKPSYSSLESELPGERGVYGASGERQSDPAAAEHHSTQGGAVAGGRRMAGGHAAADKSAGATAGRGERERKGTREREQERPASRSRLFTVGVEIPEKLKLSNHMDTVVKKA
uniref:BICD family-like cargo adapter 2 isoform X4 n=1 Tax=Oncorhynchus gorbuscha TaxID=8017 RepID=UPI001EAEAE03|nr:BICD family-like cargo adapter 2 isoform X4 [Oncorhynchus gorbuscha]